VCSSDLAGAGLFAWKGGGVVAIVDASTFVIAAAATFSLHVTEVKPAPSEHHWATDLTAGVRHVWNTKVLRQMLIACLLVILPFGFYETIAFAVVGNGLHRPPTFLGVLATVQGAGAIIGGITAGPVLKRTNEGALFGLGCVMFTICSLLLIVPTIPTVMIGVVIVGASLPWILVGLFTLTQRRTPLAIQGRVYSAFDTLIGVPQTVSIAAGAGLIALVDYRLLLGAAAVMSGASAAYLLTRKEQRQPPPDPDRSVAQEPPYIEAAEAVTLPIA
jgi:MFS family permease